MNRDIRTYYRNYFKVFHLRCLFSTESFEDSLQQLVGLIFWFFINTTQVTTVNAMETTFNELENCIVYVCICVCEYIYFSIYVFLM